MLPRVTFRGLPPSSEIIEIVARKTLKLSQVEPTLRGCHVVIDPASVVGRQELDVLLAAEAIAQL